MRLEPRFSAAPLPFAPEIRWVERAAELAEVAAPPSWTTVRVEAWLDWADSLPLDVPAGTPPTLALEVGRHNISVNTLMAGLFDTPLVNKMIDRQPELSKDRLGNWVPMGRIGEPREFANVAATLVSPNSRFITGSVTPVDGGSLVGAGFGSRSAPA